MITNSGKLILGKFLINQTSSYASHLAVGCGADPRTAVSFALSSKARSAGTVTIVTSAAHDLRAGDSVLVEGCGSTYDGMFSILTVPSSTSFTYTSSGSDLSTTSVTDATVTLEFGSKKTLDYEMFRVPIISRSFINEDGVNKIVFAGELPTTNRYEMTEIGVYSAGSNPLATTSDSRHILLFSQNVENWQYHNATSVVSVTQPLDSTANILYTIGTSAGLVDTANITNKTAFYGSSSDSIFDYIDLTNVRKNRVETKERPRFYDNFLAMRGNTSSVGMQSSISTISNTAGTITITTSTNHNLNTGDMFRITGVSPSVYNFTNMLVANKVSDTQFTVSSPVTGAYSSGGTVTVVRSGDHIHNTTIRADLSKNSSEDQLKFAFSLLKVTPQTSNGAVSLSDAQQPDNVNIIVEFSTDETEAAFSEFARFEATISSAQIDAAKDSLYFVVTKKLSEIVTTSAFSWSNIRAIKVYVCVTEDDAPSGNYYVALDGLRFENITAIDANPIYGMTAYGIIGNSDDTTIIESGTPIPFGSPVSKKPNTNNLIEFKYSLGVG